MVQLLRRVIVSAANTIKSANIACTIVSKFQAELKQSKRQANSPNNMPRLGKYLAETARPSSKPIQAKRDTITARRQEKKEHIQKQQRSGGGNTNLRGDQRGRTRVRLICAATPRPWGGRRRGRNGSLGGSRSFGGSGGRYERGGGGQRALRSVPHLPAVDTITGWLGFGPQLSHLLHDVGSTVQIVRGGKLEGFRGKVPPPILFFLSWSLLSGDSGGGLLAVPASVSSR
jgi:hypothetical protein